MVRGLFPVTDIVCVTLSSLKPGRTAAMCLLALLTSGIASATAAANAYQTQSLKGIKRLEVLVENLDDAPNSLSKDQILTDVELRLRKAGISVLPASADSNPYLYIRIGTDQVSPGLFADRIDVSLIQATQFSRNSQLGVYFAPTWDTGSSGTVSSGRQIRDALGDLMDKFLNAYLEANPK
jgi:hypothetical protein